jgi:hypothetical protein
MRTNTFMGEINVIWIFNRPFFSFNNLLPTPMEDIIVFFGDNHLDL